jgi:hypothetical protein
LLGTYLILSAVVFLFKARGKVRRTPLTRDLLRSPGESLRIQIEEMSIDIGSYLLATIIIPVFLYAAYLSQLHFIGSKQNNLLIMLYLFLCGLSILFLSVKLWRLLNQRRSLCLGLDCELSVGQELNQLMLEGCKVYHDFPADKFNIDHVVVSPKGVFAVETKGRSKPDKKKGAKEATVVYDGQVLRYPGWIEKEPIEQSKRQAIWLSEWLSSAVGEQIGVKPVLALPGWYIERNQHSPELILFNGKNPNLLLRWVNGTSLSEVMMKRIVHQLEQRCRDVEPSAYKKSK